MLCYLKGDRLGHWAVRDLDAQRVEQLWHRAARELYVNHGTGDAYHASSCVEGATEITISLLGGGHGPLHFLRDLLDGISEGIRPTDDFAYFLGNLGLTFAVRHQSEFLD
ncbi:unannotated protein [freshwater metagenome]|uniref:Unannotated protein n=1 Tax=freshwater metagenome TaxID=449393 RepID=A0A6J7E2D1_9ZZZZ